MNPKLADNDSETDWLIDDDGPAGQREAGRPWRVLIVDDDVDVHVVTKFALSNTSFLGRRLSYLHAYSSAEALALLRENTDIAIVLLDVIMESSDSGLLLARQIREELQNKLVRIILRTGQPGQTLEHQIIVEYDINDFWCKTDLNTRKLFTTVITSLRTYASLQDAQQRSARLGAALDSAREVETALAQYAWTLTLDHNGRIASAGQRLCALLALSAEELLGRHLSLLHPATVQIPAGKQLPPLPAPGASWDGPLVAQGGDGKPHRLHVALMPLNAQTFLYLALPECDQA